MTDCHTNGQGETLDPATVRQLQQQLYDLRRSAAGLLNLTEQALNIPPHERYYRSREQRRKHLHKDGE